MSFRDVTSSQSESVETAKSLVEIRFTEGAQIYAIWNIQKGKKHGTLSVQVSEALRANIMGRAGVQALIDNIRDDTVGNVTL